METISVAVSLVNDGGPRRLHVSGERMLVGHADTGIFRIVGVGGRPASLESRSSVGVYEDGLALATIETNGRLEVADLSRGSDPYNRHGLKIS